MQEQELEPISDDDFEGEHEELDRNIHENFAPLTHDNIHSLGPLVLSYIIKQSDYRLLSIFTNIQCATDLINAHEGFRDMMIDGWSRGFKSVRLCNLLRPHKEMTLVDKAWNEPFVGGGADALWEHICYLFTLRDGPGSAENSTSVAASTSSDNPSDQYSVQYCPILQSSGMGKSRAVDEMSKNHFVIPIVLREHHSSGHPPSDRSAYVYFLRSSDQFLAFIRSCGFLHALFLEAAAVVRGSCHSDTAASFREYMKKGMKFREHGKNRVQFFEKVTSAAGEYATSTYFPYFCCTRDPSSQSADVLLRSDSFPLRQPFHELCRALQDESVIPSGSRKRLRLSAPLIIIAFDEIHTLVGNEPVRWCRFAEIRRVIRGLYKEPLFALFISTSPAAFTIMPNLSHHVPSRMVHNREVMLPFCELGFDQFAKQLDFSRAPSLSEVMTLEHLVSYGRPLWGIYQEETSAIEFAAFKLSGGEPEFRSQPLSLPQQLACLSRRIPIEFFWDASHTSDAEKEQVHYHLRVLMKAEDNLAKMVTVSPSEPILSEAAYFLMSFHPFPRPIQALQNILNGSVVNKGNVGELLVALLFVMARDDVVGPADHFGQPSYGRLPCRLPVFLSALFSPPSSDGSVADIRTCFGWRFSAENVEPVERRLEDVFEDSKVYFTHFIKAEEEGIVHVKHLMPLMARGAALLCADGQDGVHGIIPFLLKGDNIQRDNIGAIMFQVRNDRGYVTEPESIAFRAMDPRSLLHLADVPVIRIIFDLAGRPALKLVPHTPVCGARKSYTAYDFWVAGLSPAVLTPIRDEAAIWNSILRATKLWEMTDPREDSEGRRKLRMMMMDPTGTGEIA